MSVKDVRALYLGRGDPALKNYRPAWLDNMADDATVEGSMLDGVVQGAAADTVNAYLAGKIDQWYFRTDGKGVAFIVNASTPEGAKNILEKFPLGQAGLMSFDYIPLGPLSPLRIINDMVK